MASDITENPNRPTESVLPTLDAVLAAMGGADQTDPIHIALAALHSVHKQRFLTLGNLLTLNPVNTEILVAEAAKLTDVMSEPHRRARDIDQHIATSVQLPAAPDAPITTCTLGDIIVTIAYVATIAAAEHQAGQTERAANRTAQLSALNDAYTGFCADLTAGNWRLPVTEDVE